MQPERPGATTTRMPSSRSSTSRPSQRSNRSDSASPVIRIATRASPLARWQAERVGGRLGHDVEYVLVTTTGDRDQTSELHAIGGQGVFTKEVQHAVIDGRADVAVHSAKDLPTETPPELVLATIPERADPRDALVGCAFDQLAPGARIG